MSKAGTYYYDQLNKDQQKVYYAIKQGLLKIAPSFPVLRLDRKELGDIYFMARMRQFGNPYINQTFDGEIPARGQAYGALFLASEMGQYMTGQNLVIEKGRYFN